ncbi:MAG: hypothetical protein HQL49_00130 [Gammaproteobacteria bacterium]|nr:hypothetical protein [Gammaproteobacteria bacterium]
MRRKIQVRGATLDNGKEVRETDEGVVSVFVHPDKTVSTTDGNGHHTTVEGTWTTYTPRVL